MFNFVSARSIDKFQLKYNMPFDIGNTHHHALMIQLEAEELGVTRSALLKLSRKGPNLLRRWKASKNGANIETLVDIYRTIEDLRKQKNL